MSAKSKPVEAEIVGENPSKSRKKSQNNSKNNSRKSAENAGQKYRENSAKNSRQDLENSINELAKRWKVYRIIVILALILVVCLCALLMKFLVGIFAWILQFGVVVAAILLICVLIYSFIKFRK